MKSYVPFLSLRYLLFHKVSTALGILGVTLGVGLIIVVVGVMDGFQTRLKTSLIGSTAAVVVRPRYDVDAEALCRELKARVPGIVEASPVVYAYTLLSSEDEEKSGNAPCQIIGLDAAKEDVVADLGAKLHWEGHRTYANGAPSPLQLLESASEAQPFRVSEAEAAQNVRIREGKQGLVVGKHIAEQLDLRPGSKVRVMTGRRKPGKSTARGDFNYDSEVFTVTGVFDVGDTEVDQGLVLMDRRDARSFFKDWLPFEADEVRLLLTDSEKCDAVAMAVREKTPEIVAASLKKDGRASPIPMIVKTWKDIHESVLAAVDNERGLLLVITSFSFIVVAFLIGSTQSMLVVEKTREIGVLRSLGASVAGTSGVFVGNGFFIGAIGAACGWAVGISITSHIQEIAVFIHTHFHRDLFPAKIYRFKEVPIDVKGDFVLSICIGAVAFALLGAILPAIRAALLDPVESLHHE